MGQLSRKDIELENNSGGLRIKPFENANKKAASYDITPSIIAMSAKIGMLENVYRETRYNSDKYYILVRPKDTVLVVSNEYLIVPKNIAGYVSSRVSKLVEGFGHVSTTIDPNWRGAALIALSNPSNLPLKVYVGNCAGNDNRQNQLASITFHYLHTECDDKDIDGVHRGMRLDLLEKVFYKNKTGFRTGIRKILFFRRRRFTDYFFTACEERYKTLDENNWDDFLKEFSYLEKYNGNNENLSKKAKIRAVDFVITENFITRFIQVLQRKKIIIRVSGLVLVIILGKVGIIPNGWMEAIIAAFAGLLALSN